jgi:hypothetical protein
MNGFSLPPVPVELPASGQRQSRIGIAAFVLACASSLFFCVGLLISMGYGVSIAMNNPLAAQDPYAAINQSDPVFLIATLLMCCAPFLSLIGLGLGIPAVIQKTDKRLFGVIGLVLNGLIVLSYCALTAIGLFARAGV